MHGMKIIAIAVLLLIGFHLMIYSYMRRRVAAAKLLDEPQQRDEDVKRNTGDDNRY